MSTCISRQGEYGRHITDERFCCTRCFAFDEDAALAEIDMLRKFAADIKAIHALQSPVRRDYFPKGERGEGAVVAHRWWEANIGAGLERMNIPTDRNESA
jgi:hypothetical protein